MLDDDGTSSAAADTSGAPQSETSPGSEDASDESGSDGTDEPDPAPDGGSAETGGPVEDCGPLVPSLTCGTLVDFVGHAGALARRHQDPACKFGSAAGLHILADGRLDPDSNPAATGWSVIYKCPEVQVVYSYSAYAYEREGLYPEIKVNDLGLDISDTPDAEPVLLDSPEVFELYAEQDCAVPPPWEYASLFVFAFDLGGAVARYDVHTDDISFEARIDALGNVIYEGPCL